MLRVSVFIDENSIFRSSREFGIDVDYKKLLDEVIIDDYSDIIKSTFYMAMVSGSDETTRKQKGFITWLRNNGFRVVTKNMIKHGNGDYSQPGFSAEISSDVMSTKESYDVCVLVGGDDNLSYTMNKLSALGKRIIIVGFKDNIPYRLKNSSDEIIDLSDYLKEIEKDGSKSRRNSSVEDSEEDSVDEEDELYEREEDIEEEELVSE